MEIRLNKISIMCALIYVLVHVLLMYQSRVTGRFFFDQELPFDIQIEHNTGGVWFLDEDGWGVVSPGTSISNVYGKNIKVKEIVKYASTKRKIIFWFESSGNKVYCSEINSKNPANQSYIAFVSDHANCNMSDLQIIDFQNEWPALIAFLMFIPYAYLMYSMLKIFIRKIKKGIRL